MPTEDALTLTGFVVLAEGLRPSGLRAVATDSRRRPSGNLSLAGPK